MERLLPYGVQVRINTCLGLFLLRGHCIILVFPRYACNKILFFICSFGSGITLLLVFCISIEEVFIIFISSAPNSII